MVAAYSSTAAAGSDGGASSARNSFSGTAKTGVIRRGSQIR